MKRLALLALLAPTLLFAHPEPTYVTGTTVKRTVRIETEISSGGEKRGDVQLGIDATIRYEGNDTFAVQIHRLFAEGDCDAYGPHFSFRGRFDTAAKGKTAADRVYMRRLREALAKPVLFRLDEDLDPELCDGREVLERFAAWPIVRGMVAKIIPELLLDGEGNFVSSQVVREGDQLVLRTGEGETTWACANPLIRQRRVEGRINLDGEGTSLLLRGTVRSEPCCCFSCGVNAVVDGDTAEADAQQCQAGELI